MNIRQRTPLRLVEPVSAEVGKDWYRVSWGVGSLLGPEHDIRVVASGKLYRVGDLTYQRLRNGAAVTPEGWLEIDETGEALS